MNLYKPPIPATAGNIGMAGPTNSGMRQDYKNISSVPPTSGVAALLHHSQGSQFQTAHEDDRQKRIFFREKERERRRLGLSAPDNYGGSKDKLGSFANPGGVAGKPGNESFSLSRNQEGMNFQIPQKFDQPQYMPQQQQLPSVPIYNPQQMNPQAQPQFFEPQQIPQFQQYGQMPSQQPPFFPQMPSQAFPQQQPFMQPYGMPQPSYSPPPLGGFMPYQMPGQFNQFQQQPPLPQQVQLNMPNISPQGRAGGQPRQGGVGVNPNRSPSQQPLYIPENPGTVQRETFFDKFGQPDSVATNLNGGILTQQDKARKLREELEQQIQEKKKRQEEEKIEKEKWELKYGEATYNAQQAKQNNAPNTQNAGNPFPATQQFPLQNQATFQGNPPGQQQNNLNSSFNNGQPRQLPGGGTQVAHGAVPLDNTSSPNRNHPSQVDAYKNELMVQIEEKRKIKELERKKKLEEDEKEEQRVRKEMEEMQRRYQYEANPDAPPPFVGQQNDQYQNDPNNNRSVDQSQQNKGYNNEQMNGGNRQFNNYDDNNGGDQNENFDSYQDQSMNGNYRGGQQQQQNQNYSYQQNNNNSYQQQRFNKQQSRKIQVHHPQINWNEDPNVGPDSTPQAYESKFFVPEKEDNQSQAQNSQNYNNFSQNNNNNYQQRNRNDSFDNQGGPQQQQQRSNPPEQHRQQYIKQTNNSGPPPLQNEFQSNQFQQQPDNFNNYPNNEFNQQPPFFGGPQLNVPQPPPPPNLMADFDPFKQKLQQQLSTFQKDILRMQHQQKSMMKNYHKEIEMLQVKKQQIINDMKSDQDIQMKMQIQQLSTAIAQLSMKMTTKEPPYQRRHSYSPPPPNKSEIVAEVIQELKNVLQPLQYTQGQYSQSQSPPPQNFNQYPMSPPPQQYQQNNPPAFVPQQQPQYQSELPHQIQNNKIKKSRSPKNSQYMPHQQYQNQKRQQTNVQPVFRHQQQPHPQQDMQLPSTTMMMPHTDLSPVQPPLYNQQLRSSLPSSLITEDDPPLRTNNIQLAHQTELIPHNGSLIIQQQPINSPSLVENNPKMDINITLPFDVQNHKGSLIQKAKQIHDQKVVEQEQNKLDDDPLMNQKRRKSIMEEVNIGLPFDQIGVHKSVLLEKAKEIHDQPDISLLISHSQTTNKQMPKRRGSSVMQMPMMEVLKEEVEQEGQLDSDRIKIRESKDQLHLPDSNQLHIPSSSLLEGGISPNRRGKADVNIALPTEILSHRSQLLEKAQQIHDHVLPAIPPQGFDRTSLTTSQDKRRKPAAMLDYNRQSSQLSQNPIMEAIDEEEQESQKSFKQLSHRSSIRLKKQISNQSIKLVNVKSVSPQTPQAETPREEREKLLERIRQKNKREQEEEESKLNNAFVRVETPPTQIAMKIDQQKRLSRSNSELNSNEQQQNNPNEVVAPPAIQPPLVNNSRDIGTALPNKRRGVSQMNSMPNSQIVQKSQIPRIPKVPSTLVQPDPFPLLEDAKLETQTQNQKQEIAKKNELIDKRERDLPNEFIDQGADTTSKKTADADKQSQARSNKLNNQAFNEALDSIKQVQANLEARNIIGPNPIQRVNQRTKPTNPNDDLLLEDPQRFTTQGQAVLLNNHPSTITQNYSQEEFYGEIQPLSSNTQEFPMYSDQYPQYQVDQQSNQMIMQPQFGHQVNQGNNIQSSQYFQHIQDQAIQPILLNQDILSQQNYYLQNQNELIRQSLELQQQQMMSQYSPSQLRQSAPSYQAQEFLKNEVPQIEIPNPDIVYQDGFGNFVNFIPEGLKINEYYKQDPVITSSFQAIQRNPYQAQYPLSQLRPNQVKPEFDYNEEFQHMAKEDSRLPTPIGTVNQQNSEATPQEVKTPLSEEMKKPTPKIISAQRSPAKPAEPSPPKQNQPLPAPEYTMIVPANLSQVKNAVLTTETTSEDQTLPLATKRAVQPMQVPPWRYHLAPQQQQHQTPQQSPTRIVPVKADENQSQVPSSQIKGYNMEETVQYRIEQQQNVLEQELLYDQLMQYERQHLQEVQKYMIQQQAAREQLIEPYNQGVTESQEGVPRQITFPDFTGFLYNKFLVNGPPTTYTPYVDQSGPKTAVPQQNQEPSPRTKFIMQMSQNPSYTLVSRDPSMIAPEPSQPPSMMLSNLAATKPKPKPQILDSMTDVVNATQLHIPHTPSHMMRPVTQAPARRLDEEPSQEDEQKQFLMKIDQIQQIVGQYERIKKDVEYERMIQEQINNEQMSKDYMKSLKKVEKLVNDKNQQMMRKAQDPESFNIVENSSEDQLSPKNHRKMLAPPKLQSQAQSRAYTSQGNRSQPSQNLIKEAQSIEEDTMQDMSQSIQPTSSPQQKIELPISHRDQDKDKSLFSRQLSQQLNLADGSSFDETKFAKQMNNNHQENSQPLELPEINSGRGQTTGVKFLRDMLKQVPSIPSNPYQSNSQSRNSKPPLPPIHAKTSSQQSSLPQIAPKSDLNSSSYIPRHILNNPGIILPPIRQASQHSSNREFDNASSINLGNDDTQNYQMQSNLMQLKQLQRQSSSLSNIFEPLPQSRVEYKKEDPFSLRDRLKQTLQETGQILRNENISLLQKVQEAGKSIKPSFYEQGLPPIIDLAQRDLVHLSQPADYAAKLSGFNMQEDPVMKNGQFSNYDIVISSYPPGQATSFSNNFQQWDAKRTVKNNEDRYNIVRSSGTSADINPYLNNELVREIMQQRNIQQQNSQQNVMKRQNSLTKISQAPTPAQANSQINLARNSVQSFDSPPKLTLNQKPMLAVQKSNDSVKFDESMATINKAEQNFSGNSLIETKPLPQNFVYSPIQEHHSEQSHNGFSSNYDDGSRLGDLSQEPIVYRVVEHIVESPKALFGVSSTTNQVLEMPLHKVSDPNAPQQASPTETSNNNNIKLSTSSPQNPLNANGSTFGDAASKVQQQQEGDRTRQNVQNDRNISLEEETANVWVSKWFSTAQLQNNTSSSLNQLTPQ